MSEMKTREDILKEAENCVCGQRKEDYGDLKDNFGLIADFWNCYLKEKTITGDRLKEIDAKDVAIMMILLKIARIATGSGSMDSWVDIAGYSACGGEIARYLDSVKAFCKKDGNGFLKSYGDMQTMISASEAMLYGCPPDPDDREFE